MLTVEREAPEQPEVQDLPGQADARPASLYPAESRFGPTLADLLAQDVRFFVARRAGQAVGCGGYALAPGRRRWTASHHRHRTRGQGRRGGLLLETGVRPVEAIGLYRRLGYAGRGPFGAYGPDPLSVFMEKPLAGV